MEKEITSLCFVCGAEIVKKRDWKKYCSLRCRQIGWAIKLLQKAGYEVKKIT